MELTEAYSLLFIDQLVATLIIPVRTPYIFEVMHSFGGYQPALLLSLSITALTLGALGNMVLGRALATCKDKDWIPGDLSWLDNLLPIIRYGLLLIILFSIQIPTLGAVPAVAAGFFRVRVLWVTLAALIGSAGWYSMQVLGL